MIDDNKHADYMAKWNEIKEKIEGQLENMGFDPVQKKQQLAIWKDFVGSVGMFTKHGGKNLIGLI